MIKKKITNKPIPTKEGLKYSIDNTDFKDVDSLVSYIYDEYSDFEDHAHSIVLDDSEINISTNLLPYCCGVVEIGELSYSFKHRLVPVFELKAIKELSNFLDKLVEYKGKTFMINTNGKNSSVMFEKALAKCKNWVLVKEFVNFNSNNTIKMWISNNE